MRRLPADSTICAPPTYFTDLSGGVLVVGRDDPDRSGRRAYDGANGKQDVIDELCVDAIGLNEVIYYSQDLCAGSAIADHAPPTRILNVPVLPLDRGQIAAMLRP